MSRITIDGLTKRYGQSTVVREFNLEVAQGELFVFLGPSGCGKTTMLRMIAGFIEPTEGSIRLGERDITHLPAYSRNIGVVFQNYALFPHLTVLENVAFGLRRRKVAEAAIKEKVREALGLVRMEEFAGRLPRELSGGQQQRVAIARAIVIAPDILLLDEPLSNLDAKLRLSIRREIGNLQRSLGITTILVTHDQEEAMTIGDRLVVMKEGAVQQVGSPEDIYARPKNPFVADFIGQANFIAGRSTAGGFVTASSEHLQIDDGAQGCDLAVIRPEQIEISTAEIAGANVLRAHVEGKTYLGPGIVFECRVSAQILLSVHTASGGRMSSIEEGSVVFLRLGSEHLLPMRSQAA